jgi:heptosyltransferase-2
VNILVLRYRFIGDTILTVPFLRNLRRAYPDGKIDMVVAPHSSDVLIGTPYVDEFIIYDPPTIHADSRGTHKTITSKIAFISSLRGRGYDKAYVLKRSFSSALIAYLTGARERIGFDTEKRGFLLTRRVPYRHDHHEIVNFLSVLEADGVSVADDYLEAWVSEEEMAWAGDFLSESGITSGQGIVGIHPFSAVAERAWHEDKDDGPPQILFLPHMQRQRHHAPGCSVERPAHRALRSPVSREIRPLGGTIHRRL